MLNILPFKNTKYIDIIPATKIFFQIANSYSITTDKHHYSLVTPWRVAFGNRLKATVLRDQRKKLAISSAKAIHFSKSKASDPF